MRLPDDHGNMTPVKELFTYHIFGLPDVARAYQAEPSTYVLRVNGSVAQPLELSLDQVRQDFAQHERVMVLQCMSEIHWGRLEVCGPRLWDILQAALPHQNAHKIAFHGADGFDTDIGLEDARAEPEAFLLIHAINGEPLTLEHGFPVRLASDGRYGYKWPKWLERIELVEADYKGHYEDKRGWSDRAIRGERVV